MAGQVLDAVARHARQRPDAVALEGAFANVTWKELDAGTEALAAQLAERAPAAIGLWMDNTPAWVMADLAAMRAWIPLIPMPLFFSPEQIRHLIARSGLELAMTDQPGPFRQMMAAIGVGISDEEPLELGGVRVWMFQLEHPASCLIPESVAKVTYTSGTTGEPKGACLSLAAMETVASSLHKACEGVETDRHLCALPLATLLENIGGVYAPLLAGGTCVLPGLAGVGLSGASGLDAARFLRALHEHRVTTCILIPQMLTALVAAIEAGGERPAHLRYLAVGGAPVSLALLERAHELGLPVYEGYGLSEASSVVAVNTPAANRPGSVGRPLPHAEVSFAEDGEILVRGALFSGYLEDGGVAGPALVDGWWPTGDVGHMDDDGFLHLTGRKKHIFITAFGRNVSPEWVERELTMHPAVAQAVVFGEARPFNVAVLVPVPGADEAAVAKAVEAANGRLPDYARVGRWLLADEPFSVANGLFTGTGRPRRQAIWQAYRERIEACYKEDA